MARKRLSLALEHQHPTKYRPPKIPMTAIRRFARQIAERFQPDKIVLFGSYAYGKPHQESDVDLLVVMLAASETSQAIRITLAFERPFPLDIIVRTPHRLRQALADGNWFLREVMDKGKVLYEKRNHSLDSKGRRGFSRRKESSEESSSSSRPRVLPLPAVGRKISSRSAPGIRFASSANSQP
jgi:predicted nucleotidyltransferase